MEVQKVSREALEKAMQTLGLQKAEETAPAENKEELAKAEADKKAKGELEAQLQDTLKKAEEIKAKIEGKVIEKAEQTAVIEPKPVASEIIKGLEDKIGALATIVVNTNQEKDEIKKGYDALTEKMSKIVEFNEILSKKLNIVANQPMERKSVTGVKTIERFEKAEGGAAAGVRQVNLMDKAERAFLADLMYEKAVVDSKIVDKEFAKACEFVELGSLGATPAEAKRLSERLLNEHKIVVVRQK